jgi:hypothetical protein
MVRAKFSLQEIHQFTYSTKRFIFRPQYDSSIAEDLRFAKTSPSGEFSIYVDNPAAEAQFKIGGQYYFDISPVLAPDQA